MYHFLFIQLGYKYVYLHFIKYLLNVTQDIDKILAKGYENVTFLKYYSLKLIDQLFYPIFCELLLFMMYSKKL